MNSTFWCMVVKNMLKGLLACPKPTLAIAFMEQCSICVFAAFIRHSQWHGHTFCEEIPWSWSTKQPAVSFVATFDSLPFKIHLSNAGKTISFLPAICSLVLENVVQIASAGIGPVAVILCSSSSNVSVVARLCRQFVSDFHDVVQIVDGFGERSVDRIIVSLTW